MSSDVVTELHRRGHRVNVMHGPGRGGAGGMGGGQAISRDPDSGVLSGGSDRARTARPSAGSPSSPSFPRITRHSRGKRESRTRIR